MKALLGFFVSTLAFAQTGYVGITTFTPRAEGGYNVRITGSAAQELFDFLDEPKGSDVTCTKTVGTPADQYLCEFAFDGEGNVEPVQLVDEYGADLIRGWTSTWVHREPKAVVKVKFPSALARELQAKLLVLKERVETKNNLKCGRYLSRHGKVGGLLGPAPRCYVGFDPAGRALPASELP